MTDVRVVQQDGNGAKAPGLFVIRCSTTAEYGNTPQDIFAVAPLPVENRI